MSNRLGGPFIGLSSPARNHSRAAYRVELGKLVFAQGDAGGGDVFIKSGPASVLDMFEAEVEGLRELALASAIRVPAVIDCGIEDGRAFIALERLHFEPATRAAETMLGQQLATLQDAIS